MEEFMVAGSDGFLKISFDEVFGFPNSTCHWGGYNTRSTLEINVRCYSVMGELWISTGDLFKFYTQLKESYEKLTGKAQLLSYEGNLNVHFDFNQGYVHIAGSFQEYHSDENKLIFEINSDQSYFRQTLAQLTRLVTQYGGMKGVKH